MDLSKFKELPLMGIVRGSGEVDIGAIVGLSSDAGLETLEITMNTPGAHGLIKKAVNHAGNRMHIGAGTVTSLLELDEALDAGASFVVMPVSIEDVVKKCVENKIPVFPGALTPNEIFSAWGLGASMVKVFPASCFGTGYFREMKGPLKDIQLMAVGGVTPGNVSEYFLQGASAVAFGGSVYSKDLIADKNYEAIGEKIREFVEEVKGCTGKTDQLKS